MDLSIFTEGWVAIVLLVINLVIVVLALRWLWVNYKASKIIIEFAEIFREAMEREAEGSARESGDEEDNGDSKGSRSGSNSV